LILFFIIETSIISVSMQAFGSIFASATPMSIFVGFGAVALTAFILKLLSSKEEELPSLEEAVFSGNMVGVAHAVE